MNSSDTYPDEYVIPYLAGIFDGEGCISVIKPSKERNSVQLQVCVVNTNSDILKLFERIFGGNITVRKKLLNRRTTYSWYVRGRIALLFVRTIEPYLLIKQAQARLVIEDDWISFQGKRAPELVRNNRHRIFNKLKELRHG